MEDEDDRRARARVGTVLDEKWTLERLLGTGGMAAVYAARHRNGARAAVKILHPALARIKEVRERFQREGYAANCVEHAGVVKVLDDDVVQSGPDGGAAYLVMELLDGESLQDRIERAPPLGELETLRLVHEVLDVLREAHARGVVHRDLKPENLFLVRELATAGHDVGPARVKVLDFGLARLLQGQPITTYGLALGTPSFMSPEQAAGRLDEIDGRTDLFALGATSFRLRTGRRIHDGGNAVELVRKMAHAPAPRIRTIAPDVTEPFARIVDRALEFRREDRYPTADEMQSDVARAIAELDAAPSAFDPPAPPAPPLPAAPPAPPALSSGAGSAAGVAAGAPDSRAGGAPAIGEPEPRPDAPPRTRTIQVTTGDLEPSAARRGSVGQDRTRARLVALLALLGAMALATNYVIHLVRAPGVIGSRWSMRAWWAPSAAVAVPPPALAPDASKVTAPPLPGPVLTPEPPLDGGVPADLSADAAAIVPVASDVPPPAAGAATRPAGRGAAPDPKAGVVLGQTPAAVTGAGHRPLPAKTTPTSSSKPSRKRATTPPPRRRPP